MKPTPVYQIINGKTVISEWNDFLNNRQNNILNEIGYGRTATNMIKTIRDRHDWKLEACKNIEDDKRQRICNESIYIEAMNSLRTLRLTCRKQKCVNAINNAIYKFVERYGQSFYSKYDDDFGPRG